MRKQEERVYWKGKRKREQKEIGHTRNTMSNAPAIPNYWLQKVRKDLADGENEHDVSFNDLYLEDL